MISPWTKTGTKVVVAHDTDGRLPSLSKGLIVEVERMVACTLECDPVYGEILVAIKGINHNCIYRNRFYRWWRRGADKHVHLYYDRKYFNSLDEAEPREALPESITRYLTDPVPAPIDADLVKSQ